jgi:3-oxoacyl-[acyl-carrier protein] reductase
MQKAFTLTGRTALITGASRGLGRVLARRFARAGARLILPGRDAQGLRETQQIIEEEDNGSDVLTSAHCDLRQDEGRRQAAALCEGRLDILVNNAATQGPIGALESNDPRAWRETLEVNLLAPVELCRHLLPALRAAAQFSAHAKIIHLSGGGATGPRPHFSAYATAKAGLVRFSETLAEELREAWIDVNCVAPGAMNTGMLHELIAAGPDRAPREHAKALQQLETGGTPMEKAAELAVFLAAGHSDGLTGRLLSAVWDDWAALEARREELASTDIFTLRRIVPRDRGLEW